MAKLGLDGHSNGIRIVSKWLRDAGFTVIYMGLYNTAEGLIQTAMEEDANIIGCSFSEGSHMYYAKRLVQLAKKHKMDDVRVVIGGIIPPDDIERLSKLGISQVYTPGTSRDAIINGITSLSGIMK